MFGALEDMLHSVLVLSAAWTNGGVRLANAVPVVVKRDGETGSHLGQKTSGLPSIRLLPLASMDSLTAAL